MFGWMKTALKKVNFVLKAILGLIILYFVGGTILLFAYNLYTGQEQISETKQTPHSDAPKIEATAKAKTGSFENDCNSGEGKSLAHIMLQKWVRQKLIAPASAKFPWRSEIDISVHEPCDFVINGYVDSQNQYGAMLRTNYHGKLRRDLKNKDRFQLINLDMGE